MHHNLFYDYLPKHKVELFEGRVLIGSSLRVARMVLDRILRGYGPEYILPLVETHELREACIKAFGREPPDEPVYTKVAPTMPVARTASELMMNLYALRHYGIFGRDIVVKLGQNAFTPDVFLYRDPADPRMQSYYFDGAPDLIIEVMHPATRAFDAQERLSCYRAAEVPEIWLIDYESEAITVYRAADAYEACRVAPGAPLAASTLPGLTLAYRPPVAGEG